MNNIDKTNNEPDNNNMGSQLLFSTKIDTLFTIRNFHYVKRSTTWKQNSNYNILIFVTEGKCIFKLNKEEYHLQKGDVFFIPAGQDYLRMADDDNVSCSFYQIHFEGLFIEVTDISLIQENIRTDQENILQDIASLNHISANPSLTIYIANKISINDKQQKNIFTILATAYQERSHMDITTPLILSICICHLLAILNRITANQFSLECENSLGRIVPEKLKKPVRFIRQNYTRKITLEELANYCGITPQHLIRLFDKAFGCTPIHYINNLKILHAKELLHKTLLPIKKIADEIGINDPYYFSRLFHKISGEYPTAFRNRIASSEKNDINR